MAESASEGNHSDAAAKPLPQRELKHLDFFRLAALQAVVWLSTLYDIARESSGPLKPGVEAVEGAVKSVVGPVYRRFSGVPYDVLKFVDRKVDDSMGELVRFIPPAVKRGTGVARSVVDEVQRDGVVATAACLAKSSIAKCQSAAIPLYARCEPVAEHYAVAAWRAMDRLPLFHQVALIAVPTAVHWAERYNGAVVHGSEKGYAAAAYLPLVPIERIAKVFGSSREGGPSSAEAH